MADKISFDLVSPEQLVLSTEADMVSIPGSEGDMGVMAGHAPVITTLRPGFIAVAQAKEIRRFVVLGGFAEITKDKVTVLAEEAIAADAAAIEARIAVANDRLAKAATDSEKGTYQAQIDSLEKLRHAV
jgi:F-type H+-transporting ATPase subunit epsilon